MCWTLSMKSSALQGRGGGKQLPGSLGKALNASSSWRTLRIQKEPIIFPQGPWNPVLCLQMISEKFRLTGEWSTNVMPVRDAHSCKVLYLCKAKYRLPTLPLLVFPSHDLEWLLLKRALGSGLRDHLVLTPACLWMPSTDNELTLYVAVKHYPINTGWVEFIPGCSQVPWQIWTLKAGSESCFMNSVTL